MDRAEAEKELLALLKEAEENRDEGRPWEEVKAMLEELLLPENQVYLTGDTHGRFDRIVEFCKPREVELENTFIILGDAGLNYYGNHRDKQGKDMLAKVPITFFCIHGNHEMRPSEDMGYERAEYHGGKVWVQPEYPNILFAIDGEIYDFNGCSCLVIGGAYSVDKYYRLRNGWGWFPDEQPSKEIKAKVERVLEERGWKVDIVLSHTAPLKYEPTEVFLPGIDQSAVDKSTEEWLDTIEDRLDYEHWYCGHYHTEKEVDKLRFMYNDYAMIPNNPSIEAEIKLIRKMQRQAEMVEALGLLEDTRKHMLLEGVNPGATLVQIVNITHKDGSPLESDNWRRALIGRITICCFVGGIGNMTPLFEGTVRLENGEVTSVNLHYRGNASPGPRPPVEVEPGVYDFETKTSIYRFRTLEKDERNLVIDAIHTAFQEEKDALLRCLEQNFGGKNEVPAS